MKLKVYNNKDFLFINEFGGRMDKKKTNKRKKGKAARQRQRRIILSTLAAVVVVVIGIGVFLLGSCSSYETDANTIYLLEDGKVVSNSVEAFDENVYSKNDLKSYIKEVVDTYNADHQNAVKQKALNVKDGKATLVMEYATAEDFENFEGTEFFVGSVAQAIEAGYTFEGEFANVTDGKIQTATTEEFLSGDYKVVIIKANVNVSFEAGQICYVSSANTESAKDGVVVIDAGYCFEDGKLYGDVDPKVEKKASLFTPKTGCIGPLSIAMFLKNVMISYNNKK